MRPLTAMMHLTCTSICTIEPRSGGGRATIFNPKFMNLLLGLYLLLFGSSPSLVNSAVWTNGPEDKFFCGFKWDDEDCQKRQHCPSGDTLECVGNEDGVKCFANTQCDTRYGHGDSFEGGPEPPKESPGGTERPTYGGKSEDETDHYWCGVTLDDARVKCGTHCPSGSNTECPEGNICFPGV